MLEDFTKHTGIKVRYDTFDSNDTLEAKLLASHPVTRRVPTAYFLARQIAAGIFRSSTCRLPNLVERLAGDRGAGSPYTIPATNMP